MEFLNFNKTEMMYNLDGSWLGNIWFTLCILGAIYSILLMIKYIILKITYFIKYIIKKLNKQI
ncbi:MAG: hypothetical protein ACRDA3_11015 [Peptostreptococcaceae bacterium]